MEQNKEFKPYIPADRVTPELTVSSIIIGVLLAIIFGAANAYLGLRVGMTVSASIPAAVISMGIIRIILKKNSILENNIVQTIGSAGESVAAGAIFTLPALFIWYSEGVITTPPSILEITLIAMIGGLLGVFFMIPLRNALIVKEHGVLPYPEGTACAEVLLAGEEGGSSASSVFAGMGIAAFFKMLIDGLKAVPGEISLKLKSFGGAIGTQIYPAVLSVGYICGPKIASFMFAGGLLSWMVLTPVIVNFGQNTVMYPVLDQTIGQLYETGGAAVIWKEYVRYIGAGALAAGGIISLIKSLPLIIRTFRDSVISLGAKGTSSKLRTEQEIPMSVVLIVIAALTLAVWLIPAIPVSFLGAIIVVVFGFFFATVSSRMVGLVGSSNNPVSGMAIATVLFTTLILKITGEAGASGMVASIAIGSIICIVAAISGDTSQDLKTGYLLGSTPKKQQIGEILGVIASALAIGGTLYLLNAAWGFGGDSTELSAPQASIMKLIIEGVMNAQLPWNLIFIGAAIAVIVEIMKIPVLPFAIGMYLPIHLNACIMVGGIIRWAVEKSKNDEKKKEQAVNNGILYCSGMIAGEGLAGILLAIITILGFDKLIDLSAMLNLPPVVADCLSLVVFAAIILLVFKFSAWKKEKSKQQ